MDYIFTSACITGQVYRATGCSDGVMTKTVIRWALDNDIALVPLTCPETEFLGLPRQPKGKKLYTNLKINGLTIEEVNKEIVINTLTEYKQFLIAGHKLLAIVGVKFSPLCCTIQGSTSPYLQTGLLMEQLIKTFPNTPFISSTERHKKKTLQELNKLL